MSNELIVGAWRNGLDETTSGVVKEVEDRRKAGFRQLAYENTLVQLIDLLDSQDSVAEELLLNERTSPRKQESKG